MAQMSRQSGRNRSVFHRHGQAVQWEMGGAGTDMRAEIGLERVG